MKLMCVLLTLLLLTGCGGTQTFETVTDVYATLPPPKREIHLNLPEEAVAAVDCPDGGQLYSCDGYEMLVLTRPGGSLDTTLRALTGLEPGRVRRLDRVEDALSRSDFTWCAAAETGELVGRGAVLDDGATHYCLVVTAAADAAHDLQAVWNGLFQSFSAVSY